MVHAKPLLNSVSKTNRRHSLIQKGDGVVVGLSGGPDSTALALILSLFARKYRLRLYAAHLNHGLQEEAASHEILSKKLAQSLGFPFHSKKLNIRRLAKERRRSIEETGRDERYRFFAEVARRTRAKKIATAHTLDDQAETVLLRILRGTGLRGLAGIPVKRRHGRRLMVIRPFLETPKKTILDFLQKNKIPFAKDPTNRNLGFARNRVRHWLIPQIERRFGRNIRRTLVRLAESAASGSPAPGTGRPSAA
ncbi:MAG: tRNA lysidine(34) synthetase TilS [Candidatus Omnitrophica bacterium]|nr:tRNA lysidine(34) synthetase TilS [Candidatus Omnitrophota bacterium]